MTSATLTIELSAFWHAGTGRGVSLSVDAVARRDRRGLPILPARTVKGLLRDAVWQAAQLGWVGGSAAEDLFGTADRTGVVRVSAARLDSQLRDAIAERPERCTSLFRTLFSTRIDADSGTVSPKSLRSMEVVIPLVLEVRLSCSGVADDWLGPIKTALPLLRAAGSHRNRGLGRIGRLELRADEVRA